MVNKTPDFTQPRAHLLANLCRPKRPSQRQSNPTGRQKVDDGAGVSGISQGGSEEDCEQSTDGVDGTGYVNTRQPACSFNCTGQSGQSVSGDIVLLVGKVKYCPSKSVARFKVVVPTCLCYIHVMYRGLLESA